MSVGIRGTARVGWFGRGALRAALLGVLVAGCASSNKGGDWETAEVRAASQRVLWQITAVAIEQEGFPIGAGLDPSTQVATSGWRLDLAPFKSTGYREQVQVKTERLEPGRFKLFVRVSKESNEDLTAPTDPSRAKWKKAPSDPERARILIQRIKSLLGTELELQ
jgi:hypothetical protein